MPYSDKKTLGRSEEYYAAIRRFDSKEWNEFARSESGLNLPDSTIDDIKTDHNTSVKEQKYQMLRKWEQRMGRDATPELLRQKVDQFLGHRQNITPREDNNLIPGSQPTNQIDRSSMQCRSFLLKLSMKLSEGNLTMMKHLYSHVTKNQNFTSATALLMYLEDNKLWNARSVIDKLNILRDNMETCDRQDLVQEIQNFITSFRTLDEADAHAIPAAVTPSVTTRGSGAEHGNTSESFNSNKKPKSSRAYERSNLISGGNFSGCNINMNSGDVVTHNIGGNVFPDSSGSFTSLSSAEGIVQQLSMMKKAKDAAKQKQYSKPARPQQQATQAPVVKSLVKQTIITTNTEERGPSVMPTQSIPPSQSSPQIYVKNFNINVQGEGSTVNLTPDNAARAFMHKDSTVEEEDTDLHDMCTFNEDDVNVKPATAADYDKHNTDVNIYPVENNPKGHVLILNNINFPVWGDRYRRMGAELDCKLIKKLFEGLGFNVQVETDQTAHSMQIILENFAKQDFHATSDMCIVFIMSHGNCTHQTGDIFYGTDANDVKAKYVIRLFDNDKCPNLLGKPKLFFFQSCRGATADPGVRVDHADDITSSSIPYPIGHVQTPEEVLNRLAPKQDATDSTAIDTTTHPTRSDVLIAFATQQGNLSFRGWFTNAIVNVFSQKACRKHVCDMLKEVKRGLAKRESSTNHASTHGCKEMAEITDVLLKNVYFFPGFP